MEHQQHPNAEPHIGRVDVSENAHANRDADDGAKHEWPGFLQVEGATKLEDAVALREQAIARDQRRGLQWRNDVQPYARHDQAHGEAGKATDEAASESGKSKKKIYPSIA